MTRTESNAAQLVRVREVAEQRGLTVPTPPAGKHRYSLRSARASGAAVMSNATLDELEAWLTAMGNQPVTNAVEVTKWSVRSPRW